jgi:hypothetical protein
MKKTLLILLIISLMFNLIAFLYILLCNRYLYYDLPKEYIAVGFDHKRVNRISGDVEYHIIKAKDKKDWVKMREMK